MTVSELINDIESIQFEIRFSVLSGFQSVLSAMEIDETVSSLIQSLDGDADGQRTVLERIQALIPDYKSGYMHPHDITITAYLFALDKGNSLGTLMAIVDEIAALPEFWWARKLAQVIRESIAARLTKNIWYEFDLGYPTPDTIIQFNTEVSTDDSMMMISYPTDIIGERPDTSTKDTKISLDKWHIAS